jgi:hypothetical protein
VSGGTFAALDDARAAVLAEGARFVEELEPILGQSLRVGFERLCIAQPDRIIRLDGSARVTLDEAVDRAIAEGVARVLGRLRSPEIWLAPLTAPELSASEHPGWSMNVPEWVTRMLRGRGRGSDRPSLGALDDPTNRIWVALSSAATPLDPVLQEFGFRPGRRRLGGGSFGVQAAHLPQLDPSGILQRCWKRYRAAYQRLIAFTDDLGEDPGSGSAAGIRG